MMLDNLSSSTSSLKRELDRFLASTGRSYWEQLIKKIDSQQMCFREFTYIKNPLAKQLKIYFEKEKKGQSIGQLLSDDQVKQLLNQIVIINRILFNTSQRIQKKIVSRIKDKDNSRSILHELDIAGHFLNKGFDVTFTEYERDIQSGKTFDFFIKRDDIQAEVECKFKSYEAGRKISRGNFYSLCDLIIDRLNNKKFCAIISISTKSNLPADKTKLTTIANNIARAIDNGLDKFSVDKEYFFEIEVFSSTKELMDTINIHKTNKSHSVTFQLKDKQYSMAVEIECEKDERVVSAIFEELKDARTQFSKKYPGLIAVGLEGVYPEEWDSLITSDSSLYIMTNKFFAEGNCPYIHTISYSSEASFNNFGKFIQFSRNGLLARNPYNALKDINIFSHR